VWPYRFFKLYIRATEQEALKSGTNSNKFTSDVQSPLSAAAETAGQTKDSCCPLEEYRKKTGEDVKEEIYDSGLSSFLGRTIILYSYINV